MLIVRELSIRDHEGRQLIDGLSFTLNPKDKIAIIGEEGNGKSTLLKFLYDKELIRSYCEWSGSVAKQIHHAGYLPQMLDPIWNDHTVISYLLKTQPEDVIDVQQYNELEQFYELCYACHLDTAILDRDPFMHKLSGGERIKVQMLKILHQKPDILFLDEPTNDLDIDTLEWLEEFLLSYENPVLFISHDETLLENVANGIIHLEQLKRKRECKHTVVHLTYQEYIRQRSHLIERQNTIARKEHAKQQKQLAKWRQIYQKVEHRQATISRQDPHGGQLLKKKMKAVKAMKRRIDAQELTSKIEPEEAMNLFFDDIQPLDANRILLNIDLKELKSPGRILAKDVKLLFKGQDNIVIIGNNGSGKTTLLKLMKQLLESIPDAIIGYMPQNYDELLDPNISPISFLAPGKEKEAITKARTMLGNAKFLPEEMGHPIRELSGGQKAKLILVHLILKKANVLILDEPTRNLSPLSNPVIRSLLQDYPGAVLAVSHDRKYIDEVTRAIYELTTDGLIQWEKQTS